MSLRLKLRKFIFEDSAASLHDIRDVGREISGVAKTLNPSYLRSRVLNWQQNRLLKKSAIGQKKRDIVSFKSGVGQLGEVDLSGSFKFDYDIAQNPMVNRQEKVKHLSHQYALLHDKTRGDLEVLKGSVHPTHYNAVKFGALDNLYKAKQQLKRDVYHLNYGAGTLGEEVDYAFQQAPEFGKLSKGLNLRLKHQQNIADISKSGKEQAKSIKSQYGVYQYAPRT